MSLTSNSEANTKKKQLHGHTNGSDDADATDRVLSPLILAYLVAYFKNDGTITACRTHIDAQVCVTHTHIPFSPLSQRLCLGL